MKLCFLLNLKYVQKVQVTTISGEFSLLPTLSSNIFSFKGTEYFWATNSTLFLQTWAGERCSGMHFTMNPLVAQIMQMVCYI